MQPLPMRTLYIRLLTGVCKETYLDTRAAHRKGHEDLVWPGEGTSRWGLDAIRAGHWERFEAAARAVDVLGGNTADNWWTFVQTIINGGELATCNVNSIHWRTEDGDTVCQVLWNSLIRAYPRTTVVNQGAATPAEKKLWTDFEVKMVRLQGRKATAIEAIMDLNNDYDVSKESPQEGIMKRARMSLRGLGERFVQIMTLYEGYTGAGYDSSTGYHTFVAGTLHDVIRALINTIAELDIAHLQHLLFQVVHDILLKAFAGRIAQLRRSTEEHMQIRVAQYPPPSSSFG